VTWGTSVSILVFLGLSVLDLGPMYATDRQTSDAHIRLMPPTYGRGHNKQWSKPTNEELGRLRNVRSFWPGNGLCEDLSINFGALAKERRNKRLH